MSTNVSTSTAERAPAGMGVEFVERGSPSAFLDFSSEVERPFGSCVLSQTEGKENLGTAFFFLSKFWNNMLMLAQVPHPLLLCKDIG